MLLARLEPMKAGIHRREMDERVPIGYEEAAGKSTLAMRSGSGDFFIRCAQIDIDLATLSVGVFRVRWIHRKILQAQELETTATVLFSFGTGRTVHRPDPYVQDELCSLGIEVDRRNVHL